MSASFTQRGTWEMEPRWHVNIAEAGLYVQIDRKEWDQAPESGENKLTVHGKKENIQCTLNVAINLQNVMT